MTGDGLLAGRYRLAGQLGRGGMGTVWRARDEMLDRDVAVKELTLPREMSPARRELAVRRALREARAAARLRHPGIITVHDVVTYEGRPWIVMELLSGRSLDKVIEQDGPMGPRRAAEIGAGLLDALRAAHERGVLHRDLKPANVFLRDDGRAVLTDFGIATLAGDAALTRPGALIGSPAYMAPERIRGEPGAPPSDLWSLGATLYALVEGRPPFRRGTPMGVLGAVLADEPAAPRRAGPLTGILLRLLAKDPAARPTAAHARRELAAIAEPETGPEPGPEPAVPAEPPQGHSRRRSLGVRVRPGRRLWLAAPACLVAAGIAGFTLLHDDRTGGRAAADQTPIAAVPKLCDLISAQRMARLIPDANTAGGQMGTDLGSYFDQDQTAAQKAGTDACQWYGKTLSGYSALIRTRLIKPGPRGRAMKPARGVFARLRQDAADIASQGNALGAPRPVPGTGDEAFAYEDADDVGGHGTVVVTRTRNLLTEVQFEWFEKDKIRAPGAVLARLREGAPQIARWMDQALRSGRPVSAP